MVGEENFAILWAECFDLKGVGKILMSRDADLAPTQGLMKGRVNQFMHDQAVKHGKWRNLAAIDRALCMRCQAVRMRDSNGASDAIGRSQTASMRRVNSINDIDTHGRNRREAALKKPVLSTLCNNADPFRKRSFWGMDHKRDAIALNRLRCRCGQCKGHDRQNHTAQVSHRRCIAQRRLMRFDPGQWRPCGAVQLFDGPTAAMPKGLRLALGE